ncbi:Augurin-A [Merluccius polli]|uniref:Augurin-A n=1 Tax=Merluccius polli TaxID=89951 RepID=A0AA47MTP6_MERPO|nr:Augurin-A [Merluccius polli]
MALAAWTTVLTFGGEPNNTFVSATHYHYREGFPSVSYLLLCCTRRSIGYSGSQMGVHGPLGYLGVPRRKSLQQHLPSFLNYVSFAHFVPNGAAVCGAPSKPASVAITPSKAQEFLAKLNRPKRYIWNRSQSDVQQWIQQFMYMGLDEKRLEVDLAYWWDRARGTDPGRQHHYDEDAPMAHWDPSSHRHGADVNYDYY